MYQLLALLVLDAENLPGSPKESMMCISQYLLIFVLMYMESCNCSLTNCTQRNCLTDFSNQWRSKMPAFPHPVLYDSDLSNSIKVDVHVPQDQNCSNASFSFMPPAAITCSCLNYLLVLFSLDDTAPRLEGPFNSSNCRSVLSIPIYNLRTDARYAAYVVAYNNSFSFKSTLFHFTTTDVSWATLVKGPENMMVTCRFIPDSRAKGCLVQIRFVQSYSEHQEILHIPRLENSHLASRCLKRSPESHPQAIIVRDWKLDGRTGSLSVLTFTVDKQDSPCLVDIESMWKRAGHLSLFCMAAVFMIGGTLLLCSGLFCRAAGLNKYLKTQPAHKSYKEHKRVHWDGAIQVDTSD